MTKITSSTWKGKHGANDGKRLQSFTMRVEDNLYPTKSYTFDKWSFTNSIDIFCHDNTKPACEAHVQVNVDDLQEFLNKKFVEAVR